MPRQRRADNRPLAMHHVENAGRHARLVKDLGIDHRRKRRVFAGLQHTAASRRDGGKHLQHNLVDRPVPRRDQPADSDRLANDDVAILQLLTFHERVEGIDETVKMPDGGVGLHLAGKGDRRTHFHAHCLSQLLEPALAHLADAAQQRQPVGLACQREAIEGGRGSGHGAVDILGISERDSAQTLAIGRVHHRHCLAGYRRNPFAADIELGHSVHWSVPSVLWHCLL